MNGIADGSCLHHLNYLLEFLAAWEKRPGYLTPMAYQWCSALSEAAGRLGPSEILISLPRTLQVLLQRRLRLQPRDLSTGELADNLPRIAERGFSEVGLCRGPVRLDVTSHHTPGRPRYLTPPIYPYLLSITLEIGFRHCQSALHLDHTSHHEWVFETAFSSDDDEIIADAVWVWVTDEECTPPGSCAHYISKRVERDTPLSPGLQRASIHAIERIWPNELEVSGLETVRWLNRLDIGADDIGDGFRWIELLTDVIRSPMGLESLSSSRWWLLGDLVMDSERRLVLDPLDLEVMSTLEEAEDWEKLEVWMVVVWAFSPRSRIPESIEDIERATLKLFSRRSSALLRFEGLCEARRPGLTIRRGYKDKLRQICDQVRVGQSPPEGPSSPLPP